MLQDLIICCDGGGPPLPLDADGLANAAHERWGSGVTLVPGVSEDVELRLDVAAEGPGYYVSVVRRFSSINLDGTFEQNAATAVWLRSLMPADAPPVVAFDSGYTALVPLHHGISVLEFSDSVERAIQG